MVRRDLFRRTEVFIADQARAHRRWLPTFVGALDKDPVPSWARVVPLSQVRLLRRAPASELPTVVHAHFGPDGLLGLKVAKLLGAPLVVTFHGFDVTRSRQSMLLSRRPHLVHYALRSRMLFQACDAILAVSSFIRERAIEWGAPPDRVRIHHIGIPLRDAPTGSARSDDWGFRISHVGRLVEKKGTAALLHAVSLLPSLGCTPELVIVGAGPERRALEQLCAKLRIADRVTFLGERAHRETLSIIAGSDVLCVPSQRARNGDAEGLGMVLLEAAHVGVPIVATRSGGISDFVVSGVTGLLSEEGDVQGLAENLVRVHANPGQLRSSLVDAASAKLRSEFDVERNTALLEVLFDRLTCASPL